MCRCICAQSQRNNFRCIGVTKNKKITDEGMTMSRTLWKMVYRCRIRNAIPKHWNEWNTRTQCNSGAVLLPKIRIQFSISRIGFGLTCRWIRSSILWPHTRIIFVIFYFNFWSPLIASALCLCCRQWGAKINDESMQLKYRLLPSVHSK